MASKVGKPTRLTPEISAKIISVIQAGHFMTTAARAVSLHINTLKRWLVLGSDVVDDDGRVLEKGREPYRTFRSDFEQATAISEIMLLRAVQNGGWKGAAWTLARRYPDRWREKKTVEMTGGDGKKLPLAPPIINLIVGDTAPLPWRFTDPPDEGDEAD